LKSEKEPFLWPLALLGILVSVSALFTSKRNKPVEPVPPQNNVTHKDPNVAAKLSLTSNAIPANPNEDSSNGRKQRTPLWEKLAVLAALGLLAVTSFQLRANLRANKIATEAYRTGQRAFVIYDELEPVTTIFTNPRGKDSVSIEITARWKNAGVTPAVSAVTFFEAMEPAMATSDVSEQLFINGDSGIVPKVQAIIGPQAFASSVTFHSPEQFATEHPEVPRLFWGWITYRDIFANTKKHLTEFCWKVPKIEQIGDGGQYFFTDATVCDHHNCIDEFCSDYSSVIAASPYN
jgi:hypothetical protein